MDIIFERYEIATSRIREIINEDTVSEPFKSFFCKASEFICKIDDLNSIIKSGEINDFSLDRLKELNKSLFEEIYSENYEESFANPEYAVKTLGEEYGKILCYIYTKNRGMIRNVYMGRLEEVVLQMELFTQIYNYFEDVEQLEYDNVYETVYSYEKDNTEIFTDLMIEDRINPDNKFAVDIVMNSDLNDLRYLYKYGEHVGFNELKMAEFLNSLSQEEIDRLAKVYTEGYRIGFINTGKDISKKGTVDIRYSLGFERIIRSAIFNFKKMGLEPVIYQVGYSTTSPNRQYAYDHRYDDALYLDKAYIKRKLEVSRHAYESRKQLAGKMAGPAVIEIFGETPFEPENKKQAYALSEEQQKLKSEYITEYQTMVQEYIKGDERSFTIIAFPIPEFGDDFEQMFKETVKINTLDSEIYGKVQQNIIDALDQAEYVKVLGKGDNKTNMKVQMHDLKNPLKETNFENCLADVNIPLGEVFTSPKLKGTEGILHVSQVYLNDLKYNDLQITFEDGKIKDYTCKNFDTEEENKKFIKQNVMFNHETLPIGEFAIGTNTTAYMVAKKYHVVYKLPILIVEKMGPHFAVGDTCYTYDEDNMTYNPDGKAIIARDNSVSIRRKEDISKAYFNCHTDITIPYDELGAITVIRHDGSTCDIIRDGRFVLEGVEELNKPLDTLDAESK